MAWHLELSDMEFKITMINMLRELMGKVDNMLEQTGNISRELEIRGNQMEILEIKNSVIEMNAFGRLNSRWDMTKKRINLKICQQKPSKLKCKEKTE